MNDNLKTILKYIQLYTECDDYAMGKIALLFDLYPIEKIKIKTIEKEKVEFMRIFESIDDWTDKYLISNNLSYVDYFAFFSLPKESLSKLVQQAQLLERCEVGIFRY